ncbi:MAG TPA: DUF1707 domain-containing protein [Acidimicrobiales bacterium]|jgi:class 3 adenylate cyclase
MADGGARIGDAERQAVIDLLRHHTGQGRLTLDEFAERAGQVYAAKTHDELTEILSDLPEGVRPATPSVVVPTPQVGSPATPARRRRFVAIMSGSEARGPWRAPSKMTAMAFWGGVHIDLRNALIESSEVVITAWAIMGSVTVTVPPGIPVELDGMVVMGGNSNTVRNEKLIPGAPLVRVRARGLWGGVTLRNPSKKRWSRERHRHSHRGTPPDIQGLVGRHRSEVQGMVDNALDAAQRAIDRALTTGAMVDRIPPMPNREDRDTAPAGVGSNPGSTSTSTSTSRSAEPAADPTDTADPAANGSRIPSGTLTILISDIAGSTQLAERLGDQVWVDVLQTHNAIVRQQVADHSGVEVKNQGDGFLVVFPSARAAVLAGIDIQRAMAEYRKENPEVPLDLRLGLHTGEVIATDDDVFGQNVVVASRIADTAEPGEIVVSGLTRDLTASASDLGFGDGVDVDLKGVSQPWRVHRVLY